MALKRILSDTQTNSYLASVNQTGVSLENARGFSVIGQFTNNTPSAKTFVAGTAEVQRLTIPAFAGITARDYIVISDTSGNTWAVYADKSGADAAPTGAIYTAVNAARKVKADISGATTAAQCAAIFKTAFESLTGLTTLMTFVDNSNGTLDITHTIRTPVTDPVPHNLNDSGAGSLAGAQTTGGVASKVDTSTEYISITAHGLTTGLKGQASSSGTLPAGLSTSTDYYVISIDANTIQLATSYANALAGTAINLTDQGTNAATHTFTPTTLAGATAKLQASHDNSVWVDVTSSSQNITATGNLYWNVDAPYYNYVRVALAITAGILASSVTTLVKGED